MKKTTFTNPQLSNDTSHLAKIIFNFVIDNGYDVFTSDYEMQHDIISQSFFKNHIQKKKEKIIEELNGMNFYDKQLFENVTGTEELRETQETLYNFQLAIIDVFNYDGVIPQGELSTTSASPPLTRKVGNNKLDIKPTEKDYGLLFG